MLFDCAVIGLGLIGSAAARYLSATGLTTLALGPAEPDHWETHQGVFASHYDAGRITRILDKDLVWATLAARSIAQYPAIEAKSGVQFHHPVGLLRIGAIADDPEDSLTQTAAVGQALQVDFTELNQAEMAQHFPFLQLPSATSGLWERGGAGVVAPRALVQAQLTIAAAQGATVVRATAVSLERDGAGYTIVSDQGQRYQAAKVLISAGAWSGSLLARPLALDRQLRTVALAQVSAQEVERLRALPSLIYRLDRDPEMASVYSNPPLPYPDGSWCLKIGGVLHNPYRAETTAAIGDWFRKGGDPQEVAALRRILLTLLPDLQVTQWGSKPCVITNTATDYPYIDQIDENLFVATGGCGAAAKSSDEIGRLGALLVEKGAWTDALPADKFTASFMADEAAFGPARRLYR
ncbi:MAG: FAD-dependent oxidoreductase [Caldilineaceae bacterium]